MSPFPEHAIPLARYAATPPEAILLAAGCDLRVKRGSVLPKEPLDVCIAVVPVGRISEIGIKQ